MTKALFILALTATFAVLKSSAENYCNIKTCEGPNHTICRYGFLKINNNKCGKVKSWTLNSNEIAEILAAHNKYRQLVASGGERRGNPGPQPASSNLGSLTWDKELADVAQSWADQCNYGHDKCRNVARFQVGQNAAETYSTGGYNGKWSDMVKMWYDEVELFDRNQVKSFKWWKKIAHYTQMVWAGTKYLGCGGVRYNDGKLYKTYLVCNYGPTGNWEGEEIYQPR